MFAGEQVNLCFHGIGEPRREREPGEARYWISRELFRQVLDLVVGRPHVALSFDDGNACDVDVALPELRERGLRATFFPLAGRLGQAGSVDPDGLRELVGAGMTVGSHGMAHRPWSGLDRATCWQELEHAREVIGECAGVTVAAAALPLGAYDRRTLQRLRALGYAQVFSSDRARARPAAWLQPRYSVRGTDTAASVRRLLDTPPSTVESLLDATRMTVKRWR